MRRPSPDFAPTRRALLRGAAAAPLAAALPWDLAQAQAPSGTLRIGMTLATIPLPTASPTMAGRASASWASPPSTRCANGT